MSYIKYIDALAKMDDIVALSANVSPVQHYNKKEGLSEEITEIHTKWDELYEFVYANFKEPNSAKPEDVETVREGVPEVTPEIEEELVSMREMFSLNREEIEAQLYEIPPKILEQCFPVWMARYMLGFANVPVMPVALTTFTKFHHMYGYMIIYCQDW